MAHALNMLALGAAGGFLMTWAVWYFFIKD